MESRIVQAVAIYYARFTEYITKFTSEYYQSNNVKSRDESCVQNDQSLCARGTDSDSTPKGEAEARP